MTLIENNLLLSGVVCKAPLHRISPSGIPHCQFVIEHRSVQNEANLCRQAWCQMPVIVSGYENQIFVHNIILGDCVIVQGFVNCHKITNGLTKIVLHAKHIELINSGD